MDDVQTTLQVLQVDANINKVAPGLGCDGKPVPKLKCKPKIVSPDPSPGSVEAVQGGEPTPTKAGTEVSVVLAPTEPNIGKEGGDVPPALVPFSSTDLASESLGERE
jgi:hypothetical protein